MTNAEAAKTDFFNKDMAERYDDRNSKLAPISDCMHFLTRLVLRDLPEKSKVLCVGVGTGAEIISLAKAFPKWTFVGVDPSADMLTVGRERMKSAGFADRCEFVHGYVHDVKKKAEFDLVVSFLVGHFVKRAERLAFYQGMSDRLKPEGMLVNAEISSDLNSVSFPALLHGWEGVQELMGGTPESLATLPKMLREMLTVLPPNETEELLRESGIETPTRFFQALMISAWYGYRRRL